MNDLLRGLSNRTVDGLEWLDTTNQRLRTRITNFIPARSE
jgi:hypothetical protein